MQKLMPALLTRGDTVAIERGLLRIQPASGRAVPEDWLASNRTLLIREIVETTGLEAFEYIGYSTGAYGRPKAEGVTLRFISVKGALSRYSIFNAHLTRQRNTATKKAGSPLPKNHFRVGKGSGFYKFWTSTGLPVRRLSDFHDYMGNLSKILFTGTSKDERIEAATLLPLSISAAEISSAFADSLPTETRQSSDTLPTRASDKGTPQSHESRALQPDSTTCALNHGNTVARGDGHTNSLASAVSAPDEQTCDEWLAEYDNAPRLMGAPSANAGKQTWRH